MTLEQDRLRALRLMGQRDQHEGRRASCPVFITRAAERAAYYAGWRCEENRERRRAEG